MRISDTFIINLQDRPRRREFALRQASVYKLPDPHILVASTPRNRRVRHKSGSNLAPSEKACCVSHIRVWETYRDSQSPDWILVMEDDAFGMVPVLQLHQILQETIRIAPLTIDVINIGARRKVDPSKCLAQSRTAQFGLYQYDECLYHAYLIRKQACNLWSELAWNASKAVDKVHQLSFLSSRYCVLVYRGQLQPAIDVPEQTNCVKLGRGVFGQLRGLTFASDLLTARDEKKVKRKTNQLSWYLGP